MRIGKIMRGIVWGVLIGSIITDIILSIQHPKLVAKILGNHTIILCYALCFVLVGISYVIYKWRERRG